VGFATVANGRFFPGVEALLLSILAVYPDFRSSFHVFHDGSLTPFHQDRLRSIYPAIQFVVPRPVWASALPLDSPNRERIGLLGYLNIYALSLEGYRRVIVLDSDVLVVGPLDPLWADGDAFRAVIDCGATPYGLVSPRTGRPILNSGLISIPGWALGEALLARIQDLITLTADPYCPILDAFADQRVWNQLLLEQPLELMPINFNCNIKYLVQFLEGCIEGISLIHFAGPKPWLIDEQQPRSRSVTDHWLWIRHTRLLRYRELLRQYRAYLARTPVNGLPPHDRSNPVCEAVVAFEPASLLTASRGGDVACYLILHSPEQFGGDWSSAPVWPAGWAPELLELAKTGRLHVWAPFRMRPLLERLDWPGGAHAHYVLLELPFSMALPLDPSADPVGFEPWHGSAEASMLAAVHRRVSGSLRELTA
jgi:lipopolysaccharide biosynthesis glycosyltransferase